MKSVYLPGPRAPKTATDAYARTDLTADMAGLESAPCDPLILAVRLDGHPLKGLTARVDWRLGGRLSKLVVENQVPSLAPLLLPPFALLPCGRLLLWRVGVVTAYEMAQKVEQMGFGVPGLCPVDFAFTAFDVDAAFEGRVILYGSALSNDYRPLRI